MNKQYICPHCRGHLRVGEYSVFQLRNTQSLDAELDENLIQVLMIDEYLKEHQIYFSRIAGEKSTYQVSDEGITACGEHSHRYTIFKLSDELLQYLHD